MMQPEIHIRALLKALDTIDYALDISALDEDDYTRITQARNDARVFLGMEPLDVGDDDEDWEDDFEDEDEEE